MSKFTCDDLNEIAVKIIMLAGDARVLLSEAMQDALSEATKEQINEKTKAASEKIAQAHRLQTDIIQETVEENDLQTTLLFSHAQDSLMTVYSESRTIGLMIEMYQKLSSKFEKRG